MEEEIIQRKEIKIVWEWFRGGEKKSISEKIKLLFEEIKEVAKRETRFGGGGGGGGVGVGGGG